jgi:hypothetical protein
MADNLSYLISDAFTIYSEAYRKIGQIGVRIVELDKAPSQPQRWSELVYATRLFRNISPSITLNGGGTAIIGVVGEIETMNNLLLKLKRAVKLYNVPVFPTPLTEFVFNLGTAGGADVDATYVTVAVEGGLPQSRRLAIGAGLLLSDGGGQGNVTLTNAEVLTSLQFDSSVNPVLDLAGFIERLFYGSTPITGTRTWSLLSATNTKRLQALFSISGLTPGDSTHDQTLWANTTIITSAGLTPSAGVFQPLENREYEIDATTYDGVNWRVNIF